MEMKCSDCRSFMHWELLSSTAEDDEQVSTCIEGQSARES